MDACRACTFPQRHADNEADCTCDAYIAEAEADALEAAVVIPLTSEPGPEGVVYPCRTYAGAFCASPDCRADESFSHSPDIDLDDEPGGECCGGTHGGCCCCRRPGLLDVLGR